MGCEQEGINPSEEFLAFYPASELTAEYPFAVSGESVVFHRNYKKEDDESIADDEYAEDFFFEIEEPRESFELHTEDLQDIKTTFLYYCYCGYTEHSALKEGTISGTRISATSYEVDVDVTYEYYVLSEDTADTLSTFTHRVQYTGVHGRDARPN